MSIFRAGPDSTRPQPYVTLTIRARRFPQENVVKQTRRRFGNIYIRLENRVRYFQPRSILTCFEVSEKMVQVDKNPELFSRAFHGVEPHRCAVFLFSKSHGTVRCGAVFLLNGAVRCGLYFSRIVRCGYLLNTCFLQCG